MWRVRSAVSTVACTLIACGGLAGGGSTGGSPVSGSVAGTTFSVATERAQMYGEAECTDGGGTPTCVETQQHTVAIVLQSRADETCAALEAIAASQTKTEFANSHAPEGTEIVCRP